MSVDAWHELDSVITEGTFLDADIVIGEDGVTQDAKIRLR